MTVWILVMSCVSTQKPPRQDCCAGGFRSDHVCIESLASDQSRQRLRPMSAYARRALQISLKTDHIANRSAAPRARVLVARQMKSILVARRAARPTGRRVKLSSC
jgi:hypothetical protein